MEANLESASSSATPSPSRRTSAFDVFRSELEALEEAQTVLYFRSEVNESLVKEIVRTGEGCKKLLGALQIKAEGHIRKVLGPQFWTCFSATESRSWDSVDEKLEEYCQGVYVFVVFFEHLLDRMSRTSHIHADYEYYRVRDLKHCAQLRLLEHQQPSIQELIMHTYTTTLNAVFMSGQVRRDNSIFTRINRMLNALMRLGLEDIQEQALRVVLRSNLRLHLISLLEKSSGAGGWDHVIAGLADYANGVMLPFLQNAVAADSISRWEELMDACVRGALGQKRIEQLFHIVTDFPTSRPAVSDIKASLELGHFMRTDLARKFCQQVKEHLLQAGTGTRNIVHHFLKAARMFYEIDPDGGMMETVAEVYRGYLQGREDTMRYIVAVLADTKQEAPCILEELADTHVDVNSEEDESPDVSALRELRTLLSKDQKQDERRRKNVAVHDIVSTLESICSSQNEFVDECQKLLAEHLCTKADFHCDRECRVVELLKKRYGETALRKCEVMLNDVMQSRLLNGDLQNETEDLLNQENTTETPPPVISATMISYLFWPSMREPEIQLPPEIQRALDIYAERYHLRKAPRKLEWKTGSGVVALDVEVGGEVRSFRVTPVLAVIVLKFTTARSIRETTLARDVGIDVSLLRSKITFWLNNGILQESNRAGEIWYHRCDTMHDHSVPFMDDSDEEFLDRDAEVDVEVDKLKCVQKYIVDFLKYYPNGTSLDNIHQHLGKFIKQHDYDMTQAELEEFLTTLTSEEVIEMTDNGYKNKNKTM